VSKSVFIKNRQRSIPINVRHLRWLTRSVLEDLLWVEDFDLAVYIVRAPLMAGLNKTHLGHAGSTDVITFDYTEASASDSESQPVLQGELFICIDEAVSQARQFRTTWQSELARYVIHGILHLRGYDDLQPDTRRKMKRQENRLLKKISKAFPLRKLASDLKLTP
jgi:probable rRNA maturation factor